MNGDCPAEPATGAVPAQWWLRLPHDLRGPVAPMRMAVQMLRTGMIEPAGQPEALRMIDRQIDLLLANIDQFGDLLRINAGTFELHPELADLDDAFELLQGRSALMRELEQCGVTLVAEPCPTPLLTHYDSRRLASVLEFIVLRFARSAARGSVLQLVLRRERSLAIWSIRGDAASIADDVELQWLMGVAQGPPECEAQAVLAREVARLLSLNFRPLAPGPMLEFTMPLEP